ncbi:type VI secretion system-associated FHA domain protein TagH [Methylocaldum szegediense]|uniref:Type VI secretion system protein n=1 Tax=Methylocaldum szegediense TaxID=73780 RepID=A0ABN8X132_9GAMM|nr:type VI secretion system-associated FHA domain protein TagH [Methylocaldum szegediense]CAI8798227.1 type VI secretion system protein [Methylocaldum szegediense]
MITIVYAYCLAIRGSTEARIMALILKVLSYKGSPVAEATSCTFDQEGGSIGRSPDNRFVLPDPDKFISRKHGSIEFRNGVYSFTDSSTAGTYFVNKDMLLQHDTAPLSNGDVLRIGEYEIAVVEVPMPPGPQDEPSFGFDPFGEPPESPNEPLFSFGPFGKPPAPPEEPSFDFDPFGEPPVPPAAPVPEPEAWAETPAWSSPFDLPPAETDKPQSSGPSFIGQPDVSPFHESFIPPDVEKPQESPELDFNFEDLLRDLDSGGQGPEMPAPVAESWEPEDDFFKGIDLSGLGPEPDATVEPQAMTEPAPDFGPAAESVEAAHPPSAENLVSHEQAAVVPSEEPAPSRATVPAIDAWVDSPVGGSSLAAAESVSASPPVPSVPSGPAATHTADRGLFAAFLEGAGIASNTGWIKDEDMPAVMKTVGVLLRSFVEGMMTVMRARAELKSQFRVSVTTMRPVENNPLKFTPNVDDALKIMLAQNHPGFMDPVEAVRGGFADLMNHQMAMTAGIQAALAAALKRFDPQRFEKLYEEGIVFQRKAKCWEAYSKAYPESVNDILENFFGEEFGEVYERQMRILQSAQTR